LANTNTTTITDVLKPFVVNMYVFSYTFIIVVVIGVHKQHVNESLMLVDVIKQSVIHDLPTHCCDIDI